MLNSIQKHKEKVTNAIIEEVIACCTKHSEAKESSFPVTPFDRGSADIILGFLGKSNVGELTPINKVSLKKNEKCLMVLAALYEYVKSSPTMKSMLNKKLAIILAKVLGVDGRYQEYCQSCLKIFRESPLLSLVIELKQNFCSGEEIYVSSYQAMLNRFKKLDSSLQRSITVTPF